MVTEKTIRYTNKNMDLDQFSQRIVDYLNAEGYMTQKGKATTGTLIQARKENILRDIFTADRAFSIAVQGEPNDFTVRVGIGRWTQNLSVATVETLLGGPLILLVDVPEMAWNRHVENDIIQGIGQLAEGKDIAQIVA